MALAAAAPIQNDSGLAQGLKARSRASWLWRTRARRRGRGH